MRFYKGYSLWVCDYCGKTTEGVPDKPDYLLNTWYSLNSILGDIYNYSGTVILGTPTPKIETEHHFCSREHLMLWLGHDPNSMTKEQVLEIGERYYEEYPFIRL